MKLQEVNRIHDQVNNPLMNINIALECSSGDEQKKVIKEQVNRIAEFIKNEVKVEK